MAAAFIWMVDRGDDAPRLWVNVKLFVGHADGGLAGSIKTPVSKVFQSGMRLSMIRPVSDVSARSMCVLL